MVTALVTGAVAIVTAGIGASVGWFTVRSIRRKNNVESDSVVVAAAERVVGLLDEQVKRLEGELEQIRQSVQNKNTEIMLLKAHVRALEAEVKRLGGNLPPFPSL